MVDPGRTREYFSSENRAHAELEGLPTRDESELYDDDDMETSAADTVARESGVGGMRSSYRPRDGEVREPAQLADGVVERDVQRDFKSYDPKEVRAENLERPDVSNVRDQSGQARLFSEFEVSDFRLRWNDVQTGFVDSPRHAVQQADQLVATVMERITNSFTLERSSLEKQWDRGDHVSTEDLRVALQRYREFFGRLLNAA